MPETKYLTRVKSEPVVSHIEIGKAEQLKINQAIVTIVMHPQRCPTTILQFFVIKAKMIT